MHTPGCYLHIKYKLKNSEVFTLSLTVSNYIWENKSQKEKPTKNEEVLSTGKRGSARSGYNLQFSKIFHRYMLQANSYLTYIASKASVSTWMVSQLLH